MTKDVVTGAVINDRPGQFKIEGNIVKHGQFDLYTLDLGDPNGTRDFSVPFLVKSAKGKYLYVAYSDIPFTLHFNGNIPIVAKQGLQTSIEFDSLYISCNLGSNPSGAGAQIPKLLIFIGNEPIISYDNRYDWSQSSVNGRLTGATVPNPVYTQVYAFPVPAGASRAKITAHHVVTGLGGAANDSTVTMGIYASTSGDTNNIGARLLYDQYAGGTLYATVNSISDYSRPPFDVAPTSVYKRGTDEINCFFQDIEYEIPTQAIELKLVMNVLTNSGSVALFKQLISCHMVFK